MKLNLTAYHRGDQWHVLLAALFGFRRSLYPYLPVYEIRRCLVIEQTAQTIDVAKDD